MIKRLTLDDDKPRVKKLVRHGKKRNRRVREHPPRHNVDGLKVVHLDNYRAQRGGAPTKFKEDTTELCYRMRLLGLNREQILHILGVDEMTLDNWRAAHPEFHDAWERGGMLADANVAAALYWRATGYTYDAEKLFYDSRKGEVIRTTQRTHCPPDVTAANMWLTNRARDLWRNKIVEEHTGADGGDLPAPMLIINPVVRVEGKNPHTIEAAAYGKAEIAREHETREMGADED